MFVLQVIIGVVLAGLIARLLWGLLTTFAPGVLTRFQLALGWWAVVCFPALGAGVSTIPLPH